MLKRSREYAMQTKWRPQGISMFSGVAAQVDRALLGFIGRRFAIPRSCRGAWSIWCGSGGCSPRQISVNPPDCFKAGPESRWKLAGGEIGEPAAHVRELSNAPGR